MNIYYSFYCKAYDWYNTTGKKSEDTLRGSAIILVSAMTNINLMPVIIFLSILNKHTLINKWVGLLLIIVTMIFNFILISSKKSDLLRGEYLLFDESKKKRINFYFYLYLIVSALLLISSLIFIAYYKKKYGNYDL
jgi:hypothetical protein